MRTRTKLVVSWKKPNSQEWSGEATRYEICYSTEERILWPKCSVTIGLSYEITSFKPATKYFVTVSAGTSDGFGPKSAKINEITYGGMSSCPGMTWPSLWPSRRFRFRKHRDWWQILVPDRGPSAYWLS